VACAGLLGLSGLFMGRFVRSDARPATELPADVIETTLSIPNSPSLANTDYYVQTLFLRGGALHLSSSSTVWIR